MGGGQDRKRCIICKDLHNPSVSCDQHRQSTIITAVIKDIDTSGVKDNDLVNNPSHYADSWEFEVYEAIHGLLQKHYGGCDPYKIWQTGQELKYRLRAGLKQYDGLTIEESAQLDIAKAMRCRQMRDES